MNFWSSFFLGAGAGGTLLLGVVWLLLNVAASTPQMALTSLAACLRGFARNLDSLHVVVLLDGQKVMLPFEQIVTAIENAELSMYRCDWQQRGPSRGPRTPSEEIGVGKREARVGIRDPDLNLTPQASGLGPPSCELSAVSCSPPRSERNEDSPPATLPSQSAKPS